ncbi:hypothetical protein [Halospeciosus flavus]|uniref:Uncharacterized protein n=2 Tax=Halospeciosus flavus TaxID=3032283 RepID=A0ABD5Z3F1_9EURY
MWRTLLRTIPSHTANPSVTDSHVVAARKDLQASIDRAQQTWDRVSDKETASSNLPAFGDPGRNITSAQDYLTNAERATGWDAIVDIRLGMMHAGRAIGGARLALDKATGEQLADQAREIQQAIANTRQRITYTVGDPQVDLARLYWVERWLGRAKLNSYRNGTFVGQDTPITKYDPEDTINTWGTHLQARRQRADAARHYKELRATLDERSIPGRDLTAHVRDVDDQILADTRDRMLSPQESERSQETIRALPAGPHRTIRSIVLSYIQNTNLATPNGLYAGLPLYRTVRNAESLLKGRAFDALENDIPLDADADRVPAAILDRTKARGLTLLRERIRTAVDRPLLSLLIEEGHRLIQSGDTELGRDSVDNPRARAYTNYRLAVEYLDDVETITAQIDQPS